jgi:microcompartment protein CcmK/EutM
VLILDEGNSARMILGVPRAPMRTVVVGVVDSVDLPESGGEDGR